MSFRTVAVFGSGTMGNGIAHAFAQAGRRVLLMDVSAEFLDRALGTVRKNLDRQVKKGTLTEAEAAATIERITTGTDPAAAREAELVVEAVPENFALKADLFRRLDGLLPEDAILATNTSSLPVTRLAAVTRRPDRFVGMHFMNPVPVMKLVEIIRGELTSDAVFAAVEAEARALGKTPVASSDYPGFIANRILMPLINEAVFALMEGVASKEAIDTVMKLGMNHPMGPLELADFIGLDVCLSILEVLHQGFGDPKYRPAPLLRRMVEAGLLGRKSGRGFYSYTGA